jgi:hypothetical protein
MVKTTRYDIITDFKLLSFFSAEKVDFDTFLHLFSSISLHLSPVKNHEKLMFRSNYYKGEKSAELMKANLIF